MYYCYMTMPFGKIDQDTLDVSPVNSLDVCEPDGESSNYCSDTELVQYDPDDGSEDYDAYDAYLEIPDHEYDNDFRPTVYIGFTINKNCKKGDYLHPVAYREAIDKLDELGVVKCKTFEYGKQNRLHVHGILELDEEYYEMVWSEKPTWLKGFKFHYEQLYNYDGWYKYIMKDQ